MNLAHLHLLLNHWPIIGSFIGLGLLLVSILSKSDAGKRLSLAGFTLLALVTIPTYISGNAAEVAVAGEAGVQDALIRTHEGIALIAFTLMQLTGAVAWYGLWQSRRRSRPSQGNVSAVVLLAIGTVALMALAGNTGGEIRHPEVRPAQEATETTLGAAIFRTVASVIIQTNLRWAASETFHFLGMALLFGVALLVNLRILGFARGLPFPAVHSLLPWGVAGFAVNLLTGMLFFISGPMPYSQNIAFQWKIALVLPAGVNLLYFTVFDVPWTLGPGDHASFRAKVIATSTLLILGGIIFFGRMIPFMGDV